MNGFVARFGRLLRNPFVFLGAAAAVALAGGGGGGTQNGGDGGDDLPSGDGDPGDNWGNTPTHLRPLFELMEEVSGIPGAARFFAVVARAEANWVPTAQNDSKGEVAASAAAYDNNQGSRPYLYYAQAAATFGSGGLFGQLAPYFLWTASAELKGAAPLLDMHPSAMFQPRLAGYAAVVLLRRILTHYQVDDLLDARVGWAGVAYLGDKRYTEGYYNIRATFEKVAAEKALIDLSQLPARLEPGPWVGFAGAYDAMMEG